MRKILSFFFIFALAAITFANTDDNLENPWAKYDWPFAQLPRWETKAEKEAPYQGTDRITPPPSVPVTMHAEFALREGVILRYPFGYGDQPFLGMVDNLQDVGVVYILVANAAVESDCYNYITSHGIPWENIECIYTPTDAMWTRDYGPWFVWEDDSTMSIVDMIYYNDRPHDDFVPEFLETYWGLGYYGPDIDHEGGNMMTDGHGTMMMTTHVYEANPGITAEQVNQIYREYFGQDTTYIFERIALDATGHIDLWGKIMNDTTILVAQMQPGDVNYQLVENHAQRMSQIPTAYGGTFNIIRCPMPPVAYWWILPYYRSYINSVLFNNTALVPVYGLRWDQEALDAYQEALGPNWNVIGIDCNSIAWAGGAIHCTTIGVPPHPWDYIVEVALTLESESTPITIPANGGSFNYYIEVENLESELVKFDVWIDVTLPNGSEYGPVILRRDINLPALQSVSRNMTQYVPENAPAGTYQYHARAGSHLPEVICAEETIVFEKLEGYNGIGYGSNWRTFGWDEGEEGPIPNAGKAVPDNFSLGQNYPNPFNPVTTIPFHLNQASEVELNIYNVNGQLLETLAKGSMNAGNHNAVWNAANVPSGVYFYSLKVNDKVQTRKTLLVK